MEGAEVVSFWGLNSETEARNQYYHMLISVSSKIIHIEILIILFIIVEFGLVLYDDFSSILML